MKKTIALLACGVAAAGSVQAQAILVGFDFANINDVQTVGDFNANASSPAGALGAADRALITLYTENSAYASDGDPYSGFADFAGSGWWQAGDAQFTIDSSSAGDNNLHTVRGTAPNGGTAGGPFTNDPGNKALRFTGAVDGGWFSFGVGAAFTGLSVSFDTRADPLFAQTQTWHYISAVNAGDIATGNFANAVQTGTFTPGASYAEVTINLGDVDAGFLVFTVSTDETDVFSFDGNTGLLFDNVTFQGTVIPEPSSYAAILGGLALAGVALRRRSRVA